MTNSQLTLLPPATGTPARERLPESTRRLGLAQLAHARAVLEAAGRARREREAQSADDRRIGPPPTPVGLAAETAA